MNPFVLLCLAAVGSAAGAQPLQFLRNGTLEVTEGWSLSVGSAVSDAGRRGRCLRVERGVCSQDVVLAAPGGDYTCSVWMKVEQVTPSAPGGFAFAAVYQYSLDGALVEFRDFAQLTEPGGWTRQSFSFRANPLADIVSMRLGFFNASGVAYFDDAVLTPGMDAADPVEVAREQPGLPPRVAILTDPAFPTYGAPSDPAYLAELLQAAGIEVEALTADQLSSPGQLSPDRQALLVVPTGQTFPAEARRNLVAFLHGGGDLLTTGGYPFQRPLVRDGAGWIAASEWRDRRLQEGLAGQGGLVPDPGFEQDARSTWEAADGNATRVAQGARSGQRCARVQMEPGQPAGHSMWRCSFTPKTGQDYLVVGWLRTASIEGDGFAYLAVYQYGEDGKLVDFHDICHVRGTTDWARHTYGFRAAGGATRVELQCGIYRASGTAWFDDVVAIESPPRHQINTSDGQPGDGLVTSPAQIGLCDPSAPLKRVARLAASPGQYVVPPAVSLRDAFEGYMATGVTGDDQARWVPLLYAYDRLGRPRGAAGALLIHYAGLYAGSTWACFSVESRDVFARGDRTMGETFVRTVRHMLRGLFLTHLKPEPASVSDGEAVVIYAGVRNGGTATQTARLRFVFVGEDGLTPFATEERTVELGPGADERVQARVSPERYPGAFCTVRCELSTAEEPVDLMEAGWVVRRADALAAGPRLGFAANYFTLNGRPVFLCGTDTYGNIYNLAQANPLTWRRDVRRCQDYGLSVYENLNFWPKDFRYSDTELRNLDAIAQLTQQHQQVFMSGLLIGGDVACDDATFEKQKEMCRSFARRYQDTPGLIYYLNGDLTLSHKAADELAVRWREYLRSLYGTHEALQAAWGAERAGASFEQVPFPLPASQEWADVATADFIRFETTQTDHWLTGLHRAIREVDPDAITTAEFYPAPSGGVDIAAGIGELSVSNIGYFDMPGRDIERLPGAIGFADMRAKGKSVSLGEFGVKMHPAWTFENGAVGYHLVRTEQEARDLWLILSHYALGLGASKIQNWCLDDASERVFPWGLFYPNDLVPKDVALTYRNIGLLFRLLTPKYEPPRVTVLLPDRHRLGPQSGRIHDAIWRTFATLTSLRIRYNTLNEGALDVLPAATRVLVYPVPYCLDDATYSRLLAFVRQGGALYVSGDVSYGPDRTRTQTGRLRELVGMAFGEELYPNIGYDAAAPKASAPTGSGQALGLVPFAAAAGIRFGELATGAGGPPEVLQVTQDGEHIPVVVARGLGKGRVFFVNDPVELRTDLADDVLRSIHAAFATYAEVDRLQIEPDVPDVHVFRVPVEGAEEVVVAVNRGEARTVRLALGTHRVELALARAGTGMIWLDSEGRAVAVEAQGEVQVDGRRVADLPCNAAVAALDGHGLLESSSVLILPFGEGVLRVESSRDWRDRVVEVGDFEDGQWRPLESLECYTQPHLNVVLDGDQAASLLFVGERGELEASRRRLSALVQRPDLSLASP
ncbi:MAG TPA: beta-galactosidase [Armatimonadota bacterium]|nr:beta-galactosidase [Armatimonadota bacterium]